MGTVRAVSDSLHPNLARLAATYDEIFSRWSRGQIDAAQARMEISALVTRDDEGILWSIDPDSGSWLRRTITGDVVADDPPKFGLATPTPHDLSTNPGSFNPDTRIRLGIVDDELTHAASSLTGSTRRARRDRARTAAQASSNTRVVVAGVAVAVAALLAIVALSGSNGDEPLAPGPAPAETSP
jgi:hypothetical protein